MDAPGGCVPVPDFPATSHSVLFLHEAWLGGMGSGVWARVGVGSCNITWAITYGYLQVSPTLSSGLVFLDREFKVLRNGIVETTPF